MKIIIVIVFTNIITFYFFQLLICSFHISEVLLFSSPGAATHGVSEWVALQFFVAS